MAIASRRVLALGLVGLLGVQGLRKTTSSKHDPADRQTKFVAGVPILNYHLAYEGAALAEGSPAREQDWNIVVDASTTDEQLHKLCQLGKCKAEGHPSKGGVPFFQVTATEADLEAILQVADARAIRYVEPDSKVQLIPEMDAEPQSTLWGLSRIGTSRRSSTGRGSHIYILDTGIRTTHNDFGGRAVAAFDATSWLNKRCTSWSPLSCADDQKGHGTHCAGTAAGASYGVAPAAVVHAVKVLGDDGAGQYSWSYEGLDYVATEGARPAVASMSLAGRGVYPTMETAIDAATVAGVTVVVAGGNNALDACNYSPAFVPSALTVGATESGDAKWWWSNYGACVGIWAPGSKILSAGHGTDDASATMSGTSMACPHVAGAAALVLEKNPGFSPEKVLSRLLANAESGAISGLKAKDTNTFLNVGGL